MSENQQVLRRRQVYHASLLAKGLHATLEVAGALALVLIPPAAILSLVRVLTQQELVEDPKDRIALWLLHQAQGFSLSTEHFYAIYLAVHGVVKIGLVVALWREWRHAAPIGMTALGLFVVWQLYRFSLTHAPFLLVLSAFDMVVIWLIWRDAKDHRIPWV